MVVYGPRKRRANLRTVPHGLGDSRVRRLEAPLVGIQMSGGGLRSLVRVTRDVSRSSHPVPRPRSPRSVLPAPPRPRAARRPASLRPRPLRETAPGPPATRTTLRLFTSTWLIHCELRALRGDIRAVISTRQVKLNRAARRAGGEPRGPGAPAAGAGGPGRGGARDAGGNMAARRSGLSQLIPLQGPRPALRVKQYS